MKFVITLVSFILVSASVFGSTSSNTSASIFPQGIHLEKGSTSTKKKTLKDKLTYKLAKKLYKRAQKRALKKGAKPMGEFEDFVALAGAIVCIVGIISIIFSPIEGAIVALLGLIIYGIAKRYGGSIKGAFSRLE